MKTTISLSFIAASLCMLIFSSCDPNNGGNTQNPPPVEKHEHRIPMEDIRNMVDKYRKERQEIINKHPELISMYGEGFQDTRSIWFSWEELRAFVHTVEKEIKEKNVNVNMDGLRLYLSVYPSKNDSIKESDYLQSIPKEYRNHTSIFMVPTYYDEKSQSSIDFDPAYMDANNTPKQLSSLRSGDSVGVMRSYNAANHGALCPPQCPSDGGVGGK